MKNPKISLKQIISEEVTSIDKIKCSKCGGAGNFKTHENSDKIKCSKCGGAGNFKTHENSRRTCLVCFGRGYINI